MSKIKHNLDALKKLASRLIKHAPARHGPKSDPLSRLVRAFLEYDADMAKAQMAEERLIHSMVDYNELRVTPAIELSAILGVRYPFADSRCSSLHRTLQAVFDREHHMGLDGLKEVKKSEIRNYLKTLSGINTYVEAAVALECFDVPAAPVDIKLTLWLKSKGGVPEEFSPLDVQQALEKIIKASDMAAFHRGARRELESWSPKVWPAVAKIPSPMLAPPADLALGGSAAPATAAAPAPAAGATDKPPAKPAATKPPAAKPAAKPAATKPTTAKSATPKAVAKPHVASGSHNHAKATQKTKAAKKS